MGISKRGFSEAGGLHFFFLFSHSKKTKKLDKNFFPQFLKNPGKFFPKKGPFKGGPLRGEENWGGFSWGVTVFRLGLRRGGERGFFQVGILEGVFFFIE